MQTRKMSAIESLVSTAIGLLVALATQMIVFPLLGIPVSLTQNLMLTIIFTIVSIFRSYCVRRLFNALHSKQ